MAEKNWGHTGTFTGNTSSGSIVSRQKAMIGLAAGGGTVNVEARMPETDTWLTIEGLDASSEVVKVYDALGLEIRLTMTSYSSDTEYWLIGK